MIITFHPEAEKKINNSMSALLLELKPQKRIQRKDSFPNDIFTRKISAEQIISIGNCEITDYKGNAVGILFEYKGNEIGLLDESFKELIKVSEEIQKSACLFKVVSIKHIYETLFEWMKQKYTGECSEEVINYLKETLSLKINKHEIWIPIAHTIVEDEMCIGTVKFIPLKKEIVNNWEHKLLEGAASEENAIEKKHLIKEIRENLQGHAIATVVLEAELSQAKELAIERVEEALTFLRLFSPSTFMIDYTCYSTIKGKEHLESFELYVMEENSIRYITKGILEFKNPTFLISHDYISRFSPLIISINELLLTEKKSPFQMALMNSINLFSQSTLMKSIPDKLVYIFAALESLLLRNDNEPIQQNLSERIAFVVGKNAKERRDIVKNIKAVYKYRSQFVHHGIKNEDLILLNNFLLYVSSFLVVFILNNHKAFNSKEQMISTIEDKKFG